MEGTNSSGVLAFGRSSSSDQSSPSSRSTNRTFLPMFRYGSYKCIQMQNLWHGFFKKYFHEMKSYDIMKFLYFVLTKFQKIHATDFAFRHSYQGVCFH